MEEKLRKLKEALADTRREAEERVLDVNEWNTTYRLQMKELATKIFELQLLLAELK